MPGSQITIEFRSAGYEVVKREILELKAAAGPAGGGQRALAAETAKASRAVGGLPHPAKRRIIGVRETAYGKCRIKACGKELKNGTVIYSRRGISPALTHRGAWDCV